MNTRVGVASRPARGERVCGDAHVVAPFEGGVLVAAIDGLGHGEEAAQAAQVALGVLREKRGGAPLALMQDCHHALKRTRGAAVSLASVSWPSRTMEWAAVGNVDALLVHARAGRREHVLLKGGIVGHSMPRPRSDQVAVLPGDTLVFATDGIRPAALQDLDAAAPPEALAHRLLEKGGRPEDDALVLVVRFEDSP